MAVADLQGEMVTPAQAARMLGRSKVRVLQLTNAGRLPCVRTPLGRLLPADSVREFIQARDQGAAPAAPPPTALLRSEHASQGDSDSVDQLRAQVSQFLHDSAARAQTHAVLSGRGTD